DRGRPGRRVAGLELGPPASGAGGVAARGVGPPAGWGGGGGPAAFGPAAGGAGRGGPAAAGRGAPRSGPRRRAPARASGGWSAPGGRGAAWSRAEGPGRPFRLAGCLVVSALRRVHYSARWGRLVRFRWIGLGPRVGGVAVGGAPFRCGCWR